MNFGLAQHHLVLVAEDGQHQAHALEDVDLGDQRQLGVVVELELSGEYRLFDYPNAFAFNEPIGGPNTREEAWVNLIAEFRMTPSLALVAEANLREVVSNDLRIQYDRSRYAISVRWEP